MTNSLPRLLSAIFVALAMEMTAPLVVVHADDPIIHTARIPTAYVAPRDNTASSAATSIERGDPSEHLPPGDRLIVQAMNHLERRGSVMARVGHQICINDRHLIGAGAYWQQGSGENLRVRLELEFEGENARLLQVSDSRFLWIDEQLPNGRNVTRLNLRQLRADAAAAAASRSLNIQPGEATWSPLEPELSAHSGGLPGLLVSLSKNFSFLPPQAMRLDLAGSSVGEAPKIPVFAVVGHWKPEKLAALVTVPEIQPAAPADANAPPRNPFPPRVPQEVLVLVGQADSFPYRVEFRRRETPAAVNENGAVIPYHISARPIAVLSFSDVAFDTPIANGQFDYKSGEVDWTDRTAERLEQLRR